LKKQKPSCKDVKKELSVGSVKLFSLWAHLILYTAELTVLHEAPESNKWVNQNGIFGNKEQAFRFIALRILFSWDFFFLLGIGLEEHMDAAVVISGFEDGTYIKHLVSKMSSFLIKIKKWEHSKIVLF
jgi:hypothetical protein